MTKMAMFWTPNTFILLQRRVHSQQWGRNCFSAKVFPSPPSFQAASAETANGCSACSSHTRLSPLVRPHRWHSSSSYLSVTYLRLSPPGCGSWEQKQTFHSSRAAAQTAGVSDGDLNVRQTSRFVQKTLGGVYWTVLLPSWNHVTVMLWRYLLFCAVWNCEDVSRRRFSHQQRNNALPFSWKNSQRVKAEPMSIIPLGQLSSSVRKDVCYLLQPETSLESVCNKP